MSSPPPPHSPQDYPKIRYQRLLQVFNRALFQSISTFQDWNKISSCFPHYAETELGKIHLENCRKQVSALWSELCEREFQEIVKDRDIRAKLDELDGLVAQAKRRLAERQNSKLKLQSPRKLPPETHLVTIPIADLSVEQIVDCDLHNQRKFAMQELDERTKIVDAMNKKLEDRLAQLEDEVERETRELNEFYEEYLAQSTKADPDKTLVQRLNDMISTLRDIP